MIFGSINGNDNLKFDTLRKLKRNEDACCVTNFTKISC